MNNIEQKELRYVYMRTFYSSIFFQDKRWCCKYTNVHISIVKT